MLSRMQDNSNSLSSLVEIQKGPTTLEDSLVVLTKLNILLPYSLSIVLLGIYSKELKTYVHTKKKIFIQMFIVSLSIIANT